MGTDTGVKRRRGKKCILFLFRSADHCESCPLSPAPLQPCGTPCPAKEPALAGPGAAARPWGHVPEWATPHGLECPAQREVPHVPRRAVPGPGPSRGSGAVPDAAGGGCGQVALSGGVTPQSLRRVPRRGQRGCPALAPRRPRCTPQTQPGEAPGAGGARSRVTAVTPGCHPRCSRQCRGSLGSPGDPHPPGAPRSEPPHQPGPGEPPRHGHPGGAGEGARR